MKDAEPNEQHPGSRKANDGQEPAMNWVIFVFGVIAIVSPPLTVSWLTLRDKK